jgi:hypothetical protein
VPAQDILDPRAQKDDGLDIRSRTRAERAGDLDGGAGFAALTERDTVSATLVRAGLTRGTLRAVERCGSSGFARLSAELRVGDADLGDELHQREAQQLRTRAPAEPPYGFDHIFCGEPAAGGSIGGLHFRGRYLQLQEQGLACRLPNNRGNEEIVPGTIYTLGVVMQVNGATARQSIKGYGLTLSAEDIFKVVTRGFGENPTQSSSSQGCLLTVEDDGARFVTVFVRRKLGVRTFFPDATPDRGRNPDCAAEIVVAGGESGPVSSNTAPVVSRPLSVRMLSAGALTELPVPADTFTDPDGDTLSLSAAGADGSPLPDWADFDSERGVLLLLPEPEDAGTRLTIVITASDGQTQVSDSVTVEVAEGN